VGVGRGLLVTVDSTAPLHRYLGTSEMELTRHTRALVTKGAVCFDVGGYDGYFSLLFARLSGASVWCFESDAERVPQIRTNLTLNGELGQRISVVETYVADIQGEDPRTDTIDDLIARKIVPVPDFVKIDVEGAESAVLSGASRLLRDYKPNLIIETHSEQLGAECVALLHAAGYTHEIVKPRWLLRENRGTGHNEWVVAVPKRRCQWLAHEFAALSLIAGL
jgi:hypothetical protein